MKRLNLRYGDLRGPVVIGSRYWLFGRDSAPAGNPHPAGIPRQGERISQREPHPASNNKYNSIPLCNCVPEFEFRIEGT